MPKRLWSTGAESWLWYLLLAANCQLNSVTSAPYKAVLRTEVFLSYENQFLSLAAPAILTVGLVACSEPNTRRQ